VRHIEALLGRLLDDCETKRTGPCLTWSAGVNSLGMQGGQAGLSGVRGDVPQQRGADPAAAMLRVNGDVDDREVRVLLAQADQGAGSGRLPGAVAGRPEADFPVLSLRARQPAGDCGQRRRRSLRLIVCRGGELDREELLDVGRLRGAGIKSGDHPPSPLIAGQISDVARLARGPSFHHGSHAG
jgi:hypothetical protein